MSEPRVGNYSQTQTVEVIPGLARAFTDTMGRFLITYCQAEWDTYPGETIAIP